MPKYRGSRKNYNVPSNPCLFTLSTGASSGGGDICPRNAAGERVSEAGPGQGPLIGGPRDADGFLKKAFDDEWKDVIYKTMDMGQREFAIEFMKNDKPAPPGSPNACLSKYERAIIATFNNITTEEMNGDIHIDELLKREAGKRPIRLPKDPLILPGVAAPNKAGAKTDLAPAPQTAGPVAFADLQRANEVESSLIKDVENTDHSSVFIANRDGENVGDGKVEFVLDPSKLQTFLDKPLFIPIDASPLKSGQDWEEVPDAMRAAAEEVRTLAKSYYSNYEALRARGQRGILPEAGVRIVQKASGRVTYYGIYPGWARSRYSAEVPYPELGGKLVGRLHFHWVNTEASDQDKFAAQVIAQGLSANLRERFEAWVASYDDEVPYFVARDEFYEN